MTTVDQWERVHTSKGWHIRFRAANGEAVVNGEVLTSKAAATTAILSVARAHSPVHRAHLVPDASVVAVWQSQSMDPSMTPWPVYLPLVDVDEDVVAESRRRPLFKRRPFARGA